MPDRGANDASARTPQSDSTLCTVRGGARFPGPATWYKTLITADRSPFPGCGTAGAKAKCMPSCAWMRREGRNGSARMGTSYVLSAMRATAYAAGKRALLQSFRDALSHASDRSVVTVNCGTAVCPPRNILHKTAFCVRYQESGVLTGGGRARKSPNFRAVETRSVANPASSAPRNLEAASSGTPAATPSPTQRPTVDLTALTHRDDFLLELGEALGGQASVNPVDSVATAIAQLASAKRGQMLVIDSRATSDVRSDVHRATQQAPNAVVVVFAEADAEKQIASAVKGTSVFAVLTIPIEGAKTAAVLDAAVTDAVSRTAT